MGRFELPDCAALVRQVAMLENDMRSRARALDRDGAFPAADIDQLRRIGVLRAPVPFRLGGLGLGTAPEGAAGLLSLLRRLGQGNLSVGRLFEAHVNALRLIFRYGDEAVQRRAAADVVDGHLVGLWVTDPPDGGLRVGRDGTLHGSKQFCSGCGHVTRAVVTAADADDAIRLVYAWNEGGFTASPLPGSLAGMRAATTGQVSYDDATGTIFGHPGDYLREPDFSCGAWRTSAVTLGGIEALTEQLRVQLIERRRAGAPAQQSRVGQALIATETARLWMAEASLRAEAADAEPEDAIAYVGLARLAVERAALDVIELTHRSLGIEAFRVTNPVEQLCRDLSTYLRQPAGDEVLTAAAARVLVA
jgi:alkylation response protein AidB-like acyl-CoA dehydrogenase